MSAPNDYVTKPYVDRKFDVVDQRFSAIDRKFDVVDQRFSAIDRKFDVVMEKISQLGKQLTWLTEKFDWMIGEYKKSDEERTLISGKLSDHEDRLETVEKKLKIYAS